MVNGGFGRRNSRGKCFRNDFRHFFIWSIASFCSVSCGICEISQVSKENPTMMTITHPTFKKTIRKAQNVVKFLYYQTLLFSIQIETDRVHTSLSRLCLGLPYCMYLHIFFRDNVEMRSKYRNSALHWTINLFIKIGSPAFIEPLRPNSLQWKLRNLFEKEVLQVKKKPCTYCFFIRVGWLCFAVIFLFRFFLWAFLRESEGYNIISILSAGWSVITRRPIVHAPWAKSLPLLNYTWAKLAKLWRKRSSTSLSSILISARWNISLYILYFAMCVFGLFVCFCFRRARPLTRDGVLSVCVVSDSVYALLLSDILSGHYYH